MSADRIVTEYEGDPGAVYITQRPAVAVLPDGRRLRLGDVVTGSYARHNDVHGPVIGWGSELLVVGWNNGSIELGPEDVLTIGAAR
ncbi:MAG TPA: hypothetical protein VI172_14820 [Candidatus Dormibacteraeota bacterium]